MSRIITKLVALLVLPIFLVACPDQDSSVGEDVEEGVEEVGDEVDDAIDN